MDATDTLVLQSFGRELEKEARLGAVVSGGRKALEFLRRRAGGLGGGAALGATGGAGLGGAAGAVKGYREAEERGESGLAGALGGLGRGAATGAAIGAGAGALGGVGALGGRAAKAVSDTGTARGALGTVSRFGQRQLHGATGLVPGGAARGTPEYMKKMREMGFSGGRAGALERVRDSRKALTQAKASGNAKAVEKATKELEMHKGQYRTAREAEQKGLTSVPGFVRSLGSKEGLKDVWRLGLKPQWQQHGATGKAMVALPAALAVPELATSAEEDPEGRGRAERFAGALGSGLGYAATPFIPMVGSELFGRAGELAGSGVGKGLQAAVGALGGKKKKPNPMDELGRNPSAPGVEESGTSQSVAREYTNAALGKPPENLMV